ncbi:MAG: ATP-binding protein [Candidatus Puniceispirillales bacterium]
MKPGFHIPLPRTLFGRMLLIILTPLIIVQLVTVLIFYERHWDTVTRYMSDTLAADIAVVVDRYAADQTPANFATVEEFSWRYFYFDLSWQPKGIVEREASTTTSYVEETLDSHLAYRLDYPFAHDLYSDPDLITVMVQFPDGIMSIAVSKKRIFSSTSWLVILWTVSTSVLLFCVAILFLRGQVRPIRRLAKAARQLGLGRPAPDFKLEGAREVRLAGQAFQAMSQRIQRQMVERTEMLAGVSHDLRTPLSRMKLQLEFMASGPDRDEMAKDIDEMDRMITGYIDFASNAVVEAVEKQSLADIVEESIRGLDRDGTTIQFNPGEGHHATIPVRPRMIRRAMDNLIGNAMRYGTSCSVTIEHSPEALQVIIDDDGPGIPKESRQSVLRPFFRLNPDEQHSGSGLGLSIANDAVLAHGGVMLLGDSPMGGLRVRVQLPF